MTAPIPNHADAGLFDRVKDSVDLNDLAERLGLERPNGRGNYRSPQHPDKSPSLSILPGGRGWKDHSTEAKGSCIDLVLYVRPELGEPIDAARWLATEYGIPTGTYAASPAQPRKEKSIPEYIADKCLESPDPAVDYLIGRGITAEVARSAIQKKALGWNTWESPKVPVGEPGHGGPGAAFIVRSLNDRAVVAVDIRYAEPELNGGVKTQCQGAKEGHVWTSDPLRLRKAHTVYVVESPINALSVECCRLPAGTAVIALRGTGNADKLDLAFLKGKRVIVALDHADPVQEHTRKRPGLAAAWTLQERLVASDISTMLVDMQDWEEGEDINDVLKAHGVDELWSRLRKLDEWLIPGMPGGGDNLAGTRRVHLPDHDSKVYWRYRVREDFTQYVEEWKDDDDGNRRETLGDLCAFRVLSLSRLRVQSHIATISGKPDAQPEQVFGVSVQVARYGHELQRRVATDSTLFNLEWWRKLGPVYKPNQFNRMLNLLERAADIGRRDVVNFVGLAWRDGELAAIEGKDCYFAEPEKQCWYHNLVFPRGARADAKAVVDAYQATFAGNAAAITLVWAIGAHLKCILGFFPHFAMQADKGSGKSKLLESLQASLAFQVLSGTQLKTDFRRRVAVSYTSHPVGWDEFSKLPKAVLGDIDGMLQNTYRYEFLRTNTSLISHLMCAPVLLAGEEVDVASLQSKICRCSITVAKQGPVVPEDLPQFPMWQWLKFLEGKDPKDIREAYRRRLDDCTEQARAPQTDATARRMMENYAAVLTAWDLLCEFADIPIGQGNFVADLVAEMNAHIAETDGLRLPWVWIVEILINEIDARSFEFPYAWDKVRNADGELEAVLCVRVENVMHHIHTAPHLRQKSEPLAVKTATIFKRQLQNSGAMLLDGIERTIRGKRIRNMVAISVPHLERLGIVANPDFEHSRPE